MNDYCFVVQIFKWLHLGTLSDLLSFQHRRRKGEKCPFQRTARTKFPVMSPVCYLNRFSEVFKSLPYFRSSMFTHSVLVHTNCDKASTHWRTLCPQVDCFACSVIIFHVSSLSPVFVFTVPRSRRHFTHKAWGVVCACDKARKFFCFCFFGG